MYRKQIVQQKQVFLIFLYCFAAPPERGVHVDSDYQYHFVQGNIKMASAASGYFATRVPSISTPSGTNTSPCATANTISWALLTSTNRVDGRTNSRETLQDIRSARCWMMPLCQLAERRNSICFINNCQNVVIAVGIQARQSPQPLHCYQDSYG